jgi:hypothetical protein
MSIYSENNCNDDSGINIVINPAGSEFYSFLNLLNNLNSNFQQISAATTNIILNSSIYLENGYFPIEENIENENLILDVNKYYIFITETSSITSFLPNNPQTGDYINVFFEKLNDNNLLFYSNGNKINGQNDNLLCDISSLLTITYVNNTIGWRIVPYFTWI